MLFLLCLQEISCWETNKHFHLSLTTLYIVVRDVNDMTFGIRQNCFQVILNF